MRGSHLLISLCLIGVLTSCGRSEQEKAEMAERKRIECLDKICLGDVEPSYDSVKEAPFKINGQWFVGPKSYGFFNGVSGFYWPSKHPGNEAGDYPEKGQPHADVAIEIYLRSNNIPPEPRGYALIELAEKNGWIADRTTLRAGLDQVRMKHVIGPNGRFIDYVTYYIATELRGVDGQLPVATCSHDLPESAGGTGFMWKPGIWAGTRMNQRHCADWPEIYQETMRVLSLLREIE